MNIFSSSEEAHIISAGLADGIDIPPALQESVQRHKANLAQLARNLQSAGFNREQIEASINVLIESYRAELILAARNLMDNMNV